MRHCVLIALFVVAVYAIDDRQETIRDINALKNSSVIYDKNTDIAVRFNELRTSLVELQKLEAQYNGKVKGKLNEAINLGLEATDEYYTARHTIDSWCMKTSESIEYVLEHQIYLTVNNTAHIALDIIGRGLEAISTSNPTLQEVQVKLSEVDRALQTIQTVIDGYKGLIIAIEDAKNNVTAVKQELNLEITRMYGMFGQIEGFKNVALNALDKLHTPVIITLRVVLDGLRTLTATCNIFVTRHGGNIVNTH